MWPLMSVSDDAAASATEPEKAAAMVFSVAGSVFGAAAADSDAFDGVVGVVVS